MRRYALAAALFAALLALPASLYAQAAGQGAPVRLEMRPWPPPVDGVVRCKAGDELQVQLVGYDSSNAETTLNVWRPTAASSDPGVATAQVPTSTGHQVFVRCVSDGRVTITAAYNQVSTSLTLQVGSGVQTTPTPSATPTPSPTATPTPQPPSGSSPQPTSQGISGHEIVFFRQNFPDSKVMFFTEAKCPEPKVVLGGGVSVRNLSSTQENAFFVTRAYPEVRTDAGSWFVGAVNRQYAYTPKGANYELIVFAVCANTQ